MEKSFREILDGNNFDVEEIVTLLSASGSDMIELFNRSASIKNQYVGNRIFYRGLIEFSNICDKDCYYCGIRKSNSRVKRYNISDDEILGAAIFAFNSNYGSVVLQAGELESKQFTARISNILRRIKKETGGKLGITISLGEQEEEVYREWFEAGAHRYLLRIESSNRELYSKIHPGDGKHNYDRRLACVKSLQKTGYQTGTGVMIGLPFQSLHDLARDILFIRDLDIDMVGMGPYVEHPNTPLTKFRNLLAPAEERFNLSLKMIAVLRIIMKDINIAAATALQALDPSGREKAIKTGANIIMPNITPGSYRDSYNLYENKPRTDDSEEDCIEYLEARLAIAGTEIGYGEWGDSKHYFDRIKK